VGKSLGKFLSYRALVEISSKLNFPLAPPLISSIQITMRCNSKCSYCDIWKLKGDSKPMPLNTLEEIFTSLRNLGVRIVSLTGGEPLMRDDLSEIIRLARHYGLQSHICTNGISLTKKKAIELAKVGISSIILSLDTLNPEIYEKHRGVSFKFVERALDSMAFIIDRYPNICCAVNCVITKHNIGNIVSFVERISECGKGKILINLQPYHPPPSFSEISKELNPEIVNKLWQCYQNKLPREDLIPNHELRPIFEREIKRLIQLRKELPLNNSVFYLKSIPDFLFNNKLPSNFNCLFGYMGFVIRYDLKVLPCWRLPPVGDLQKEKLTDIWFSRRYQKVRKRMKNLNCPGCLLLCHNEAGWFDLYNSLYKSSVVKGVEKWKS
jgi:hypothetical protein